MTYKVSNGEEFQHCYSLDEAIIVVKHWYDELFDKPGNWGMRQPEFNPRGHSINHLYVLTDLILDWEHEIGLKLSCPSGEFMGFKNYNVSPSVSKFLNLKVEEADVTL